jgi:hypothetical protein
MERSSRHGKRGQEDEKGKDLSRDLREEPPAKAQETEGLIGFRVAPLPCCRPSHEDPWVHRRRRKLKAFFRRTFRMSVSHPAITLLWRAYDDAPFPGQTPRAGFPQHAKADLFRLQPAAARRMICGPLLEADRFPGSAGPVCPLLQDTRLSPRPRFPRDAQLRDLAELVTDSKRYRQRDLRAVEERTG